MDRPCDVCGTVYLAKRPASRYCSSLCRKRAQRAGTAGSRQDAQDAGEDVDQPPGAVECAARVELEAAGRIGTVAGQAVLTLARRLDHPKSETGSTLASLARQLHASVDLATADSRRQSSALDEAQDEVARRRSMRGA